jgi:hypothetical protein
MVRQLIFITAAWLAAPLHAAEPGKIIFVSGSAQVEGQAARVGTTVQDGDLLHTAGDGYLYIRTPDQALLIVRPGTEVRFLRDAAIPVSLAGTFGTASAPNPFNPAFAGNGSGGSNGGGRFEPAGFGNADLDASKSNSLQTSLTERGASGTVQPPDIAAAAPQVVSWGRWEKVIDQAPTANLVAAGARRLASNEVYVLFRSEQGAAYATPERGSAGFALAASEAYVRDAGTGLRTAASLSNGQLTVDFAKATFATTISVLDQGASYQLASAGPLARDGQFSSAKQLAQPGTMQVNGALGGNGGATYLFEGALTPRRTISGVTVWRAGTGR